MAEQVPAVGDVLTTIERRDWARLERLLDPAVHWTTAVEEQLHGPAQVIARLSQDPPPAAPAYHEVRDGLITRWIRYAGVMSQGTAWPFPTGVAGEEALT